MKCLPQFPSVLAMYCFCMTQIPSSGFPQAFVHPPDGSDIVKLEQLAYCLNKWATLSKQPKDNRDMYKRFLFHYSRTQEPAHPAKTRFPPVHPLMRLAAKLASKRMKRLPRRDATATLGQPFFLFRPRNGRNNKVKVQLRVQGSSGKGKLDVRGPYDDYFERMSSFFL